MATPATILVHGATGFTGRLVCEALARRGLPFAAGGRDATKLARLAEAYGCETVVIDVKNAESITTAVRGRAVVLACAGPFVEIGEPMLATCARSGIAYADTTGEQRFVADMAARYRATAEARRVCVVPSLAYETAPADWAAHEAAEAVGGSPDVVSIAYLLKPAGGYGVSTTRGTKLSALRMLAEATPLQFVNGTLNPEAIAAHRLDVASESGALVATFSFPSPEALLVPLHTGAGTVRTFMAVGRSTAALLHAGRGALPALGRFASSWGQRIVARTPEGPNEEARQATFEIVAIAEKDGRRATTRVTGRDPYGLTAEIQALFAARVLEGNVSARGLVAPSQAIAPAAAFAALEGRGCGLRRSTQ